MQTLLLCILLGMAGIASADDIRPLLLEIDEVAIDPTSATYAVRTTMPPRIAQSTALRLLLPEDCVRAPELGGYRCAAPLDGRALELVYSAGSPALSGVVKLEYSTGESHTLLLRLGDTAVALPKRESGSGIAVDYTWMGMSHIWSGYDHLLFLLCLIWIAGDLKRVLITVTGFTLAHSVTLAISALDVVTLPVAAVEAVIALSVLFLAVEVVKGREHRQSVTWRYPVVVSSSFGLLHGLGFAAVLSEIGLPQTEKLVGLVFFNVGVEIGQVLFVAVVMGLLKLLTSAQAISRLATLARLQTLVGYAIGCTASFWLVGRLAAFVS